MVGRENIEVAEAVRYKPRITCQIINAKNGKIYTFKNKNHDSLIHIGSNAQPLFKRWYEHKSRVFHECGKDTYMYVHVYVYNTCICMYTHVVS